MKIIEKSLRKIWDTDYHIKIYVMAVSEREERSEKKKKIPNKIISENNPNVLKNNLHIREAQHIQRRISSKRSA